MPLLLVAGALLWIVPEPDADEEAARIHSTSIVPKVIAEHNADSSRDVQRWSELETHELVRAVSTVRAKERAEYQAIITRLYAAELAHVAAVCCWITATVSVLARTRRTRREWARRVAAGFEEQRASPESPEQRMPAPGHGARLTASSF
jgi:hypothetical protein